MLGFGSYEGITAQELEEAFKGAVSNYLDDCKTDGLAPIKPCKGSFNVRVGHDLHLAAAVASHHAPIKRPLVFIKSPVFIA